MPADFEKLEDVEKAYLAGVIDSDGCILMYKPTNRTSHYCVLDICQANIGDLTKIQTIWGGKIERHTRSNHLRWRGIKAHYILQEVFPYLKFKNEQATLMMMVFDTFNEKKNTRFTLKSKAMHKVICSELKRLKVEKYAS